LGTKFTNLGSIMGTKFTNLGTKFTQVLKIIEMQTRIQHLQSSTLADIISSFSPWSTVTAETKVKVVHLLSAGDL